MAAFCFHGGLRIMDAEPDGTLPPDGALRLIPARDRLSAGS